MGVDSRFEATRTFQEREVKKRPMTKPWSMHVSGAFQWSYFFFSTL
jgi:hypothetical protein